MLKHPQLTEERIAQFIRNELAPRLFTNFSELRIELCVGSCDKQPPKNEEFICVKKGFRWGLPYQRAWFRATGTIPKSWEGKVTVAQIEMGTEGNIWKGNNIVGGIDRAHPYFLVASNAKGGRKSSFIFAPTGEIRMFGCMAKRLPSKKMGISKSVKRAFAHSIPNCGSFIWIVVLHFSS